MLVEEPFALTNFLQSIQVEGHKFVQFLLDFGQRTPEGAGTEFNARPYSPLALLIVLKPQG